MNNTTSVQDTVAIPSNTIRFIACDLDGTLLRDDHMCSDYTKEVWKALLEKEIYFVPVTGRPFSAMKNHVPLELCKDIICTNGVHIYSKKSMDKEIELIVSTDLAWPVAQKIIDIRDNQFPNVHIHLYQGEMLYTLKENEYSKVYASRTSVTFTTISSWKSIENTPVSKIMFVSWDNSILQDIKRHLDNIEGVHAVFSSKEYLEVFSNEASKGLAIQYLLEKYDLTSKNVLALGDSYNDISMFDVCDYGYIMKNANDDLLPHLKRTPYSNNEDGVARLLKDILLTP